MLDYRNHWPPDPERVKLALKIGWRCFLIGLLMFAAPSSAEGSVRFSVHIIAYLVAVVWCYFDGATAGRLHLSLLEGFVWYVIALHAYGFLTAAFGWHGLVGMF